LGYHHLLSSKSAPSTASTSKADRRRRHKVCRRDAALATDIPSRIEVGGSVMPVLTDEPRRP
jgi:hypothetical protein